VTGCRHLVLDRARAGDPAAKYVLGEKFENGEGTALRGRSSAHPHLVGKGDSGLDCSCW
jgi:hypothetical protein